MTSGSHPQLRAIEDRGKGEKKEGRPSSLHFPLLEREKAAVRSSSGRKAFFSALSFPLAFLSARSGRKRAEMPKDYKEKEEDLSILLSAVQDKSHLFSECRYTFVNEFKRGFFLISSQNVSCFSKQELQSR